jgi:hypothetical protein
VASDQEYTQSKLNLKGSRPFRSDGSCGSQAGRLDRVGGGQRRLNESQKTTLGSQGNY